MPRVKCPHCGAGNQDATENDTCWQCGNRLGDPVARTQSASRPPMVDTGATQQLDPSQLQMMTNNRPSAANSESASQRRLALAAAVTVAVACLIIIVVVMLFNK